MPARDRSRSPHGSGEIVRLVVGREQARMNKDWELADSYREQLTALGVTLFDKTNQWKCADGRMGQIPTFKELENGVDVEEKAMQTPGNYNGPADGSEDYIKHVVFLREQARAAKDFEAADRHREELKEMGVEVFDKEKIWKASNGACGIVVGYRGTGELTDLEINTLIIEREKARQGNDYNKSDMIRDELKLHGVTILDKEKIWRTNSGRSGGVPTWNGLTGPNPVHGGMSAAPQYSAPQQPQRHPPPRREEDPQSAAIWDAMYQAGVPIDAAERTMSILQQRKVLPPAYGPPKAALPPHGGYNHRQPPPPPANVRGLPPQPRELVDALKFCTQLASSRRVAVEDIQWLVDTRERMRHSKDFHSADELRDAMKRQLSVDLFEKEKRWQASDGRQGAIPAWEHLR
eukprot:gnl/TRDRNA2_/TRDRNA2_36801_c0_seq1.p1 gnl/TRDRNA2_/TRDRNA2_36801_c0~~gnl/TRDRNA2_/TRDRNA2_36801_c0_seq1.p1  ORF type:complete len:433 (+),score=91.92 gnl/TRDRNA2_/TRDRNA2_36801_c0_seq1:86-1300(+)